MRPFEQGGLDALCGVYSIVNAARLINSLNTDEAQRLFNRIIAYLDEKHLLRQIITGGMLLKHLKVVMADVADDLIPCRNLPFQGVATPGLSTFWGAMCSFLLVPRRAVLLGLEGVYEHWTVVKSISDRRVLLFDSYRIRRLYRINCSTVRLKGRRRHLLLPAQTYFLGRE